MDDERALTDLTRLAIFPLPEVVLLPHELVPLHIFEPRYRVMTRHCLDLDAPLALACLKPSTRREQELADEAGAPRVLPVVGVGLIVESEELEDGRYNIVVQGMRRARIAEELSTPTPYRVVRADLLDDDGDEGADARRSAAELNGLLLALARARPGQGTQALLEHAGHAKTQGQLADRVGAAVIESPRERQRLLEELSVPKRLERVSAALASLLAQVAGSPDAPKN